MKRLLLALAWFGSALVVTAKDNSTQVSAMGKQSPLSFVENVGQVKDQNNQKRNDIQFRVDATNLKAVNGLGILVYGKSKFLKRKVFAGSYSLDPFAQHL